LEFPLTAVIGIARKKRRGTCTQKVTKQSLSDYAQEDINDQVVRLLDMQMLQVVKDT
jgi:hypothetical protein